MNVFLRYLKTQKYLLVGLGLLALITAGVFNWVIFAPSCIIPEEKRAVEGTQGYRIWFGETLKSFKHFNRKICVSDGWEAVGASERGDGWVRFGKDYTGILIARDGFIEKTLSFEKSNYRVRILFPADIEQSRERTYEASISNAFERVGALYGDSKTDTPIPHVVLVTTGLADQNHGEETVYPDPRENVTIFVRDPHSIRGEELFIHAVTHLYNRFNKNFTAYQKHQSPLTPEDVQELEATWAETAFRLQRNGREYRLNYLYNVHTAVQTNNFSLITEPPFDNENVFSDIEPSILVTPETSQVNIQYGHYVLAPLAMLALEGLLETQDAPADVEEILTRIHTAGMLNFFDELTRYIPDDELNEVKGWLYTGKTVPFELIQKGFLHYQ